ncbi:T9SS type A sorting domain-containing protein [candidate division KSB1 bacterium]|nr:T9SS type A sorting domain-containing protein [candidate division KSB1 bacterium]
MLKKVTLILMVLCFASLLLAQPKAVIKPMGASPAMVKHDTTKFFDRTATGLLNVGVESQMYLKGMIAGGKLTSPTWKVAAAPTGSVASITKTVTVDTSTQLAVFSPDLVGTYLVEFTDGALTASVTINSAKYLGVNAGMPSCKACHKAKHDDWVQTGHFSIFEMAMKGGAGAHYSQNCISCHTTGYDVNAKNGGFDDVTQLIDGVETPWAFPDSLKPGTWDALWKKYPKSMELARIQCESCHGPGSAHMAVVNDSKMVSSLEPDACAYCHDDDHYHVYPSQWEAAGHAEVMAYPGGTRTNCRGCHNGAQFIQFVNGQPITVQEHVNITCAVCHDPHNAKNEYQLRTVEAKLSNGEVVTAGGNGRLCMNCHQSRQNAMTYTNQSASHFGPHYAPQADMLIGTNVATFGKVLPTSPHLADTKDACIDCHMYEEGAHGEHDTEGNLNTAGMHSFSMVSQKGVDNVNACKPCHGDIGKTFAEKKFYYNGKADHDEDGKVEGLQDEVHGLIEKLGKLLPDPDPHAETSNTWTKTELKAAFNHRMVDLDGSFGIHNPAFTVALLKVSIQALLNSAIEGEIVAIEDLPNDQGKQVWIIWDKFVDDGVAVDPVDKYIVKRHDAPEVWVTVGELTADGSKRYALVVPTIYDSTAAGKHEAEFMVVARTKGGMKHESKPGMGYSVDNLVPEAPAGLVALLAGSNVQLTWEASVAPDVNYYRVYRSTEAAFEADDKLVVGTTVSLDFVDQKLNDGAYFYKVAGVDFSGNVGELSDVVKVSVTTGLADNSIVPDEFNLAQNYPNPFNPMTRIDFSIAMSGNVNISVYNTLGQKIVTLIDRQMDAGRFTVNFSGNDLSTGEYIYRIEVKGDEGVLYQQIRKMILMK